METPCANILADRARSLGRLRPLRHVPPPPEPNGFYNYNALQQLAYFGVVFVLAPLAMLTGPSMSPAFTARFPWYPKLPGNRQIGRSLHFLVMCSFLAFVAMHVMMVALTGLVRNMNHIVMGTRRYQPNWLVSGSSRHRRGRLVECARQLDGMETSSARSARSRCNRQSGHEISFGQSEAGRRVR